MFLFINRISYFFYKNGDIPGTYIFILSGSVKDKYRVFNQCFYILFRVYWKSLEIGKFADIFLSYIKHHTV